MLSSPNMGGKPMDTRDLVDVELRASLDQRPKLRLSHEGLAKIRDFIIDTAKSVPIPDFPHLEVAELRVDSAFGAPSIRVLAYRPDNTARPLPAILHLHGGGFVMGVPEMKDLENRTLATELNCAIFSVDYRLAPEAPHPALVEDVYSVLVWLHAKAS